MKVFISHSWNDKSMATNIKEVLEKDGHEVWYDIHQLIPGDQIQPKIDVYIRKCEVMVLLWSIYGFDSDGVEAEIETALKMNKRIIPLLIDGTPLEHNVKLKGMLGIPFSEFEVGILLLQRGLLMLMAQEINSEAPWYKEAFGNVVDLGGYLNYVNTYRLPGNKNEDGYKEQWALRLQELADKNEYIRQHLMPAAQNSMEELQAIMKELEHGNVPLDKLQEWRKWCDANQSLHPGLIRQLSQFIDNDIRRLQEGGNPVHALNAELIEKEIDRLEAAIGQKKEAAFNDLFATIKKYGGLFMNDKMIHSIVAGYLKYVTMCPQILRELLNEARLSEYVAVKEVTYTIGQYLSSQDHALEMRKSNLEGYFDDAYIINNTVKLLIEADLIAKNNISLDYVSMNIVDRYVSFILNKQTKARLDEILQTVRNIIGLKKKEINWSQVAAVVVGISALSAGIPYMPGMQGGAGVQGAGDNGSNSPYWEDRMAAMSAKFGGGLDFYR